MSDIVLEVIRAAILLYLLIYLIKAGTKRRQLCRKGWGFIVAGFGLLLFANVMDITDNFESLNRFVVIGDTEAQAFLEKMIGFMGGFALLTVGLIRWIPTITGVECDKELNKELEKEIAERKQSELKFKTLYESTSDAVMLLYGNEFFDCNQATVEIFGCKNKDEFCGKHPSELSPAAQPCGTDSMELANKQIAIAMEKGRNSFEWVHKRINGTDFPTKVLLNAIELNGKQVLQAVVCDITERKQNEQEHKNYVDEIERFNKLMMRREERVIEMKRQVNALLAELGKEPQYQSVLEDEEAVISSDKTG